MMGYKDRMWCSRYLSGECVNHNCIRAFTEKDRKDAQYWWDGEDFPLGIGDCYTRTCNYMPREMSNE